MQPATHGADGHLQYFGDGLITTAVDLPQNQPGAILLAELADGLMDLAAAFLLFEPLVGAVCYIVGTVWSIGEKRGWF